MADRLTGQEDTNDNQYAFYNSQTGQIEYHNADNPFVQHSIQSGTPIYFDDYGNWVSKTAYDIYQQTGTPAKVNIEMTAKEDGTGYNFNIDAPQAWLDTAQGQSVVNQITEWSDYDYISNPELKDKAEQAITTLNGQLRENNQYINDLVVGNEELRANDTSGMFQNVLLDKDQLELVKEINDPEGKLEVKEEGITEDFLRKQFGDDVINKIFEEDNVRYISKADILDAIREQPLTAGDINLNKTVVELNPTGNEKIRRLGEIMSEFNVGFGKDGLDFNNIDFGDKPDNMSDEDWESYKSKTLGEFQNKLVDSGIAIRAGRGVYLNPDFEVDMAKGVLAYVNQRADKYQLDDQQRRLGLQVDKYEQDVSAAEENARIYHLKNDPNANAWEAFWTPQQPTLKLKLENKGINNAQENMTDFASALETAPLLYASMYLSDSPSKVKTINDINRAAVGMADSNMDDEAFTQYISLSALSNVLSNEHVGGAFDLSLRENFLEGFRRGTSNIEAFAKKVLRPEVLSSPVPGVAAIMSLATPDNSGDEIFDRRYGEYYNGIAPEVYSSFAIINSNFDNQATGYIGQFAGRMTADLPLFLAEGPIIGGAVRGVSWILGSSRNVPRVINAVKTSKVGTKIADTTRNARNLRNAVNAQRYAEDLARSRIGVEALVDSRGVIDESYNAYRSIINSVDVMGESADLLTRAARGAKALSTDARVALAGKNINAVDKIARNLRTYDVAYENAANMLDAATNIERATRGAGLASATERAKNMATAANKTALNAADKLSSSVFASGMDSAQLISYGVRNFMAKNNILATTSKGAATARILANMTGEVGQGIIYTAMQASVSEDARSLESFLENAVADAALSVFLHAPGDIRNFRNVKKIVDGVQEEVGVFNRTADDIDRIKFTPDTVRSIKQRIYQRTITNENIELTPEIIDEMTQWLREDGGAVANMNEIVADNAALLAEGRANAKTSTVSETTTADNVVEGDILQSIKNEESGELSQATSSENAAQAETTEKQSLRYKAKQKAANVLKRTNIKKQQKVDNPDGTQYTVNTMDNEQVTVKYDEDSLEGFELDNVDENGNFDIEIGNKKGNFKENYWEGYKQGVTEYAEGFEAGQLAGMRAKDKLQQDSLKRQIRRGTANPRLLRLDAQDFISQNGTLEIKPLEGRYRQSLEQFKIDRSNHWGTFKFDDVSEMLHGKKIETINNPQQYANKMINNGATIDDALEWLDEYNKSIEPTTLTAEQKKYIREFRQAVKDGKLDPSKQTQTVQEGYARGLELGVEIRAEIDEYLNGLNRFIEDQMINHGKVPGLRKETKKVRKERKAQQKGDK